MNASPSAAIRAAQNTTVAALAARHPGAVTVTAQGATSGTEVRGGAYRGLLEWVDEEGVSQREQGLVLVAPKTRFPATFDEQARHWTLELDGHRFRLLSVTPWGASWLVRGIR